MENVEQGSAAPDTEDPRDVIYSPATLDVPPRVPPDPTLIEILDQGPEGANVGFALAAVLNYLRAESGIRERVSPFFLYDNARRYDEWANVKHEGSSLRGALRGLSRHGAALQSDVLPLERKKTDPTYKLAPGAEARALANRPASYERVERNIEHIKAAVHELHAVLVSAQWHRGWDRPVEGEIRYARGKKAGLEGILAIAVIGYTERGFVVQNSWGKSWGGLVVNGMTLPGCALWQFEDAAANLNDAWIVRLAGGGAKILAGYATDRVGGPDLLEVRRDAQAFSFVLASREVDPPLAIGLFGDWGGGKSFFMEMMHEEIVGAIERGRGSREASPFYTHVVPIRFNAWHFLDADLWASLVTEVFDRLFEHIAPKADLSEALKAQLVDAQGLFDHAKRQLEEAERARDRAETALQAAIEEREQQERTLATQLDDIVTLLRNDPEVKTQLDDLAKALGAEDLAKSFRTLEQQARALNSLGGRLGMLVHSTLGSPAGYLRLLALGGALLLPLAVAFGLEWLKATWRVEFEAVHAFAVQLSTLLASVTVWLSVQLKHGATSVSTLETAYRKLEILRQKRMQEATAKELRELQVIREREQAARTALQEAELRVQAIARELAERAPGRLIYRFIEERARSTEYRQHLGIVSLVRRDFERLSDLFEQGKKNASIKQIMPVERIILYIDDLDRCRPERVIEVLEAVHLLLAFPLFMVVVAVDPRWLRRCLEKQYPDLLALRSDVVDLLADVLPSRPATAQDYLEKIFQVPFTLQPLRGDGFRKLVRGLAAPKVADTPAVPGLPGVAVPATAGTGDTVSALAAAALTAAGAAPKVDDLGPTATSATPMPTVTAPPQPASSTEETIERLTISTWELRDIQQLAALFRTPRTVKRFINTYRFLRASLPPVERAGFVGTEDQPGDYRAVIVLLAVVVSYSNIAPLFLQRMIEFGQRGNDWHAFLKSVEVNGTPARRTTRTTKATPARSAKAPAPASRPSWEEVEWRELCAALSALDSPASSPISDFPPAQLQTFVRWIPRVARYSFSLSALVALPQ